MPCEVCRLNSNDSSVKAVCWCSLCSAYICKDHINDAPERILAAAKTVITKVKRAFKGKKKDETPAT